MEKLPESFDTHNPEPYDRKFMTSPLFNLWTFLMVFSLSPFACKWVHRGGEYLSHYSWAEQHSCMPCGMWKLAALDLDFIYSKLYGIVENTVW